MLNRLTIRGRLSVLLGVLVGAILTIGTLGLYAASSTDGALEDMFRNRVIPLRQLKTIADMYAVNIVENANKANNGNVPWPEALHEVTVAKATIDSVWLMYLPTYESEEEQALMTEVIPLMERADTSLARLTTILAAHDAPALKLYVMNELYPHIDPISEVINRLATLQLEIAAQQHAVYRARYQRMLRIVLWATAFAVLLAVVLSGLTIRHITSSLKSAVLAATRLASGDIAADIPIGPRDEIGELCDAMRSVLYSERNMTAAAELIAAGDLTVDVQPRSPGDTLGIAFATMASGVGRVIGEVRSGASSVASASAQLSDTAQSLARGAERQVTVVSGNARALERIATSVSMSVRNTREVELLAARGVTEADGSALAAREATAGIKAIAEKISVVEDIASQTNTLALVASLEAARAGEQGLAFAEVAREVRLLAERSRTAAVEIGSLASTSAQNAESLGHKIAALVPLIRSAAELAVEVSKFAHEQAVAVDEIHRTIDSSRQATLSAAADIEELAATAEELSAQAAALEQVVAYFQLGDHDAHRNVITMAAPRASGMYRLAARGALTPVGPAASA